MPYSTPADVRTAVASTDAPDAPPVPPSFTAADLSNATLLDSIAEADATIDSYLDTRYATPVGLTEGGTVPHPIDFWSRNIAAYLATLTYRKSKDLTDNDPIVRRYTATMLALTAVRDGKAFLPLPESDSSGTAGPEGSGDVLNSYVGQLFAPEDFNLTPAGTVPLPGTGLWWGTVIW